MYEQIKLNPRQEAFVEFYLQSGNAYQSAVRAGYSENYAKADSRKIMENPNIRQAIEMRIAKTKNNRIAQTDEILEYLTSVMRNKENEEIVMNIGKGNGITEAKKVVTKVSEKDRIRAAELLAKRYGLFINKNELELNSAIPVVIKDDI